MSFLEKITLATENASSKITECKDLHFLQHELKSSFLKDSMIVQMQLDLKQSKDIETKKTLGAAINSYKKTIQSLIEERIIAIKHEELQNKIHSKNIDITLPNKIKDHGSIHQITKVIKDIKFFFFKLGFVDLPSFEIEEDFYNFTALNVPKKHPARQMQDTFYLNKQNEKGEDYLLRTHTTGADIRHLTSNKSMPVSLMSSGKVYRCDYDRTHSPMFHQFEGLIVNENINMIDLKKILEEFFSYFFETNNINLRFRPSYFPFTEPSAEVDIGYCIKNGNIEIGGDDHFLEILGCGMLHENVFKNCNIDSTKYNSIAFGVGVDRLAMLKYNNQDLRKFFNADLNWIKKNGFINYFL